jgi:predicted LPLAT superfamily acyltransferase
MPDPDEFELDVRRDALGLVLAAHLGDFEGARAVVVNCRPQQVCMVLARIAADLVESVCESAGDADRMLATLRERHGGGPPSRDW